VVKLLFEREDVDPNHTDKDDGTPLSSAASRRREPERLSYCSNGEMLTLNLPDKYGVTPLPYAVRRGHERIAQLLQSPEFVETLDAQLPHYL